MRTMRVARGLGAVPLLALLVVGCESLEVTNPNEPDAPRALADPSAIQAVAGGTLRTWFNTYIGTEATGVLSTQAQAYSSSWNNHNMNFYSGIDNPSDPVANWNRNSRPWQNDPAAAGRTSVEWFWSGGNIFLPTGGYYGALSAATDALRAIRINNVVINNAADTRRAEAVALLMQGAALSGIALNFDKGYIVDETVDLTALQYSNRKEVRDAAVAKLTEAMSLAAGTAFNLPSEWTNGGGPGIFPNMAAQYNNTHVARIAATMAALTLAYYPRDATENAQVDWNQVAQLASQGMSSGTPFDFIFVGDGCASWCPDLLFWFNAVDAGRVHTRLSNLLDPATQRHPYPTGGNPQPNSVDRRLGDGSFGDESMVESFGTVPKTANAGTDFAWSALEVFRPDRGMYHQSNIAHVRYDLSGVQDPNGIWGGFGPAPVISAAQNDLIWAEALLRRSTPDLLTAANLINKTRVNRGALPPASVADGIGTEVPNRDGPGLMNKLLYEKEVELLGLGAAPFYERRRIPNGLIPGTPREMPVPAKELGVKGEPLYTWGGTNPPASSTP